MIVLEKELYNLNTQDSRTMVEQVTSLPTYATKPTPEDDLPPAYSDLVHGAAPGVASSSAAPSTEPTNPFRGVNPTNMLSVFERDNAIRGNYVLDPRRRIPLNLFPEQREGEGKNLNLETRDGTIDVGVWLVGHERVVDAKAKLERTRMRTHSRDGSVTVRVDSTANRDPFLLDAYSRDGRVTVALPRSFRGAIYLKTRDGKRELSEGLHANSTAFGKSERTMRYFVGELPQVDDESWEGDELRLETRDSRIKVQYIDEIGPQTSKGGFLSRVFSM